MNNNRRIWMGKGLAWWAKMLAKMLATALFLGWWTMGWLNAMKNW